jgi:hypothetical protein
MIIFESNLTTFKASSIYLSLLGLHQKLAGPLNQTTTGKFSLPKFVKHIVSPSP